MNEQTGINENKNAAVNRGESDEKLIAELENMLQKQLKLMRSSRDKDAAELVEQTSGLVETISRKSALDGDKFAKNRQNIQRLYKELTLAAAEKKQAVSAELNKIRKGKNSVKAYKRESSPTHSNLL